MARKRKRLGHVTASEREKVNRALVKTQEFCFDTFTQNDGRLNACLSGVSHIGRTLRAGGLSGSGPKLGHITRAEVDKVNKALVTAERRCLSVFDSSCASGVRLARTQLRKQGFKL